MTELFILSFLVMFRITFCYSDCGEIIENSVSESDIETILDKHNDLRQSVAEGRVPNQPKAINLEPLEWDFSLAAEAQEIADTCEFEHVKVNDARFSVGQSLGDSWSTTKKLGDEWSYIIQLWFDEHKYFIYPNITKENKDTGHYTQIVWADTYYVGCGFTSHYKNFEYCRLYVCNYGPGGNLPGQAPYEV